MAKHDERIGVIHDDRIEWPEVDINGRPYTKPPHGTHAVGNRRFVVLPFGYRDTTGALEELRNKYAPPARKQSSKSDDSEGGE